jgi:cytochrome c peroxidase
MGGSMQLAIPAIARDSAYLALFADAYGPGESLVNGENIANAIASYLRSLIGLNSRFDRYMNGENSSLTEAEKKGFNVFMGKAKCATCHFVPLFNGVAPPYFREAESEVIGCPIGMIRSMQNSMRTWASLTCIPSAYSGILLKPHFKEYRANGTVYAQWGL